MPFSGFDLMTRIDDVAQGLRGSSRPSASTRVMSVFAPKGGVGKTTIAFNLAVALGQLDQRTVLIDGSLQFGDLRSLLKVPVDAPSILDLPTDRIAESDLGDVLWRDPSGIDILLAPPRIEMAEMLTRARRRQGAVAAAPRLQRRSSSTCRAISTTSTSRSSTRATRSSRSSPTTRRRSTTRSPWPTRSASIGYPASKVRYLVNRADSPGGIDPLDLERALGRVPEHSVVSDGRLVVQSNNEGVPFVLASPEAADQPGHHARRDRARSASVRVAAVGRRGPEAGRCPIRVRSGSSTPGSAA